MRGDDTVEVRRSGLLLGAVGLAASGLAVAYLRRAGETGSWLDWTLTVLLAAIGCAHLAGLLDARTPLLVADGTGIRVRSRGSAWRGLGWAEVGGVEVLPPRAWWRDGSLDVIPRVGDPVPTLRLGLATRVNVPVPELADRLRELSDAAEPEHLVTEPEVDASQEPGPDSEPEPGPTRWRRDLRPVLAQRIDHLAARLGPAVRRTTPDPSAPAAPAMSQSPAASPAPAPLREPRTGRRVDVTVGALALQPEPDEVILPEADELLRPGAPSEEELAGLAGAATQPLIDEPAEPALDPVIGPRLRAARERLSLSVDDLADRTRIRPHVIDAVEVDDFAPCGGDFYARGHLRTLARVLGEPAAPLLEQYDERYADAPIDPRRVFEAELATGSHGTIRGTRGGRNWSVLVAAAMTVVLVWSLARLAMDGPVEVDQVPGLSAGSGGVGAGPTGAGTAVPVLLRAAGGGAHVVVRDGEDRIAFSGDLAYGASRSLEVSPPIKISSSDGSVQVVVDGQDHGPLGETGQPASDTFVAD